jgi:hypothetical protein
LPGLSGIENKDGTPAKIDDHEAEKCPKRLGEEGLIGTGMHHIGKGPGHVAGGARVTRSLEKSARGQKGVSVTERLFEPDGVEVDGGAEEGQNKGKDNDGPESEFPGTSERTRLSVHLSFGVI